MTPHQAEHSFSFTAMVSAPGAALLVGGVLIYVTGTPWQLAPAGVAHAIFWGLFGGVLVYMGVSILTRFRIADSLVDIVKYLRPLFKGLSFWQTVILASMAGIGEEVFFRGFLQTWLAGYMSVELAIATAAVVFGLMHFVSLSYFLLTTLLGMAFGFTYSLTGSLLLIIIWHGSYDIIAIWMLNHYPELLGIENDNTG